MLEADGASSVVVTVVVGVPAVPADVIVIVAVVVGVPVVPADVIVIVAVVVVSVVGRPLTSVMAMSMSKEERFVSFMMMTI